MDNCEKKSEYQIKLMLGKQKELDYIWTKRIQL